MKILELVVSTAIVAGFGGALVQEHNYVPEQGYIPDKSTAVAVGRAVLKPIYGNLQIAKQEPLTAKLEKDIWIVEGSEPKLRKGEVFLGGLAEVRISKKTGQILRVTHGK